MSRALRIALTVLAIAAIAVAVVLVVEGPKGVPAQGEGTGVSAGSLGLNDQASGRSGSTSGSPQVVMHESIRLGSGDPAPAEQPTMEGSVDDWEAPVRGDPTPAFYGRTGPNVGRTEGQRATPVRVPDRAATGADTELREDEVELFNDITRAYDVLAASLIDCASGLPDTTTDTVYYNITIRDDFERRERGKPEITVFASNTLTGDRERCAREAVDGVPFPPPHAGRNGEGPGFTVSAESRIEYTVEFEFEVGVE